MEASLTGGVDASGVAPTIAHFLANTLWQLTAFLADTLVTLFVFAFSLDLVRGSRATGGAGALEPVGEAIQALYANVLGAPWLTAAITGAGLWAMWRGLVQRRYTDTAGALGMSLIYVVLALALVTQPERTVGEAVKWTNQLSLAFLSLSGSDSGVQGAKRAAADQLFTLLVYDPWAVLQFGGREHCVRTPSGSDDDQPVSIPVRPLARDPQTDSELARRLAAGTDLQAGGKTCINNRNKYAPHFLRFEPGSDERDAQYKALNEGDNSNLPDADPSKRLGDYRLSMPDKPAADAMEEGGQYQRLLMALVVFAGALGALVLLGALCVGITLAQVLLLLLLAFAPVALVLATIPGRGHDFFRGWLTLLAGFLLRKAAYSLVLAVLLAVNGALATATSNLGWLLSFGLQALLFWAVFLYRHQLTGQLLQATAGSADVAEAGRFAALYYASRRATRRFGGAPAHRRTRRAPAADAARWQAPQPGPPPPGPGPHDTQLPEAAAGGHAAPSKPASVRGAHQANPPAADQPTTQPATPPDAGQPGGEQASDTPSPPRQPDAVAKKPSPRPGRAEERPSTARRRTPPTGPARPDERAERTRSDDSPLRSELEGDRDRFDQANRQPPGTPPRDCGEPEAVTGRAARMLDSPLGQRRRHGLFAIAAAVVVGAAALVGTLPRDQLHDLGPQPKPAFDAASTERHPWASRVAGRRAVEDRVRLFLRGYLRLIYGRGPATAVVAATPPLKRGLARARLRVPPAASRRHPQVVGLEFRRIARGRLAAQAEIGDGGPARYPVSLLVTHRPGGWRVAEVASH